MFDRIATEAHERMQETRGLDIRESSGYTSTTPAPTAHHNQPIVVTDTRPNQMERETKEKTGCCA